MTENHKDSKKEQEPVADTKTTTPSVDLLKELGKAGLPAGFVVGVVFLIQAMGISYGKEAAQERTDLALSLATMRTEIKSSHDNIGEVKNEIRELRDELRQKNAESITAPQFRLWIYKFRNENSGTGINIPDPDM